MARADLQPCLAANPAGSRRAARGSQEGEGRPQGSRRRQRRRGGRGLTEGARDGSGNRPTEKRRDAVADQPRENVRHATRDLELVQDAVQARGLSQRDAPVLLRVDVRPFDTFTNSVRSVFAGLSHSIRPQTSVTSTRLRHHDGAARRGARRMTSRLSPPWGMSRMRARANFVGGKNASARSSGRRGRPAHASATVTGSRRRVGRTISSRKVANVTDRARRWGTPKSTASWTLACTW